MFWSVVWLDLKPDCCSERNSKPRNGEPAKTSCAQGGIQFRTESAKFRGSEKNGHLENRNCETLLSQYGAAANMSANTGLNSREVLRGEAVREVSWRRERNWDQTFSNELRPTPYHNTTCQPTSRIEAFPSPQGWIPFPVVTDGWCCLWPTGQKRPSSGR